ncbi:MAG: lipoyl(octanoyl) transferase LipB [Bacteroidetes bacterium]|nr:lipoyl(octanoyl) transferase LipB [Bacteroidota bacterium]
MTNMSPIAFEDLGTADYKQVWDYQEKIFSNLFENADQDSRSAGTLLFVEHPHVYTLGKSGNAANLLVNEDFLRSKGAAFYRTNRGGDITYHGPGQLVGYPILNLSVFGIGVREYVHRLEETIIRTLEVYGIEASRLEGASGVWLDPHTPGKARKICAIGVRASKNITMHGFAFNVNTDLRFFDYINPCGFTDKGVTSMQKELGFSPDFEEVKQKVLSSFFQIFQATVQPATHPTIRQLL